MAGSEPPLPPLSVNPASRGVMPASDEELQPLDEVAASLLSEPASQYKEDSAVGTLQQRVQFWRKHRPDLRAQGKPGRCVRAYKASRTPDPISLLSSVALLAQQPSSNVSTMLLLLLPGSSCRQLSQPSDCFVAQARSSLNIKPPCRAARPPSWRCPAHMGACARADQEPGRLGYQCGEQTMRNTLPCALQHFRPAGGRQGATRRQAMLLRSRVADSWWSPAGCKCDPC